MKIFALFMLSVAAFAQTPQVWVKVGSEGSTAATSPVVVIQAGQMYRFGAGTKWCDSVTATTQFSQTVFWSNFACKVNGKPVPDPAPGVVKELDLFESAPIAPITTPAPNTQVLTTIITVNGVKMGGSCTVTLSPQP
jgi:hypothetical protein